MLQLKLLYCLSIAMNFPSAYRKVVFNRDPIGRLNCEREPMRLFLASLRSLPFQGPKKSPFSGLTPSNDPCNDGFARIKIISSRANNIMYTNRYWIAFSHWTFEMAPSCNGTFLFSPCSNETFLLALCLIGTFYSCSCCNGTFLFAPCSNETFLLALCLIGTFYSCSWLAVAMEPPYSLPVAMEPSY